MTVTNEEARKVLEGMDPNEFTAKILDSVSWYLCVYPEGGTLDGEFTADQLEAIVRWMRDPEGVAG